MRHKGFFNRTQHRDYVSPSGSRLQFALMAIFARIIHSLGSFAMIAALSGQATAQESARSTERSSCQKFAQEFYRWYVPLIQMAHGPGWAVALQRKAEVFSPDLLRDLRIDSEAQARAKGELVGIDFDPFLGSQDPADHYEARRVRWQGNRCLAEIWRASPRDTAARLGKPDVVAELALVRGHWEFRNFRYPVVGGDLVSVLAELREERRKN
jgi:hypothetical protein